MKLCRIYHHYEKWEDWAGGLYNAVAISEESEFIEEAVLVLSVPENCLHAMRYAIHNWTFSCEQNLSNRNRNRRAWLGQAACCIAFGVPEYLTKTAWNTLPESTQAKANEIAEAVIKEWELLHLKSKSECQKRA
jgi:hypothetical protein